MSRITMRRLTAVLTAGALTLGSAAATADDTEIFFNQNNSGVNANVLLILDTSGSMNDLVSTKEPYDPARTYTANTCSSQFDKTYYYFGNSIPTCASSSKLKISQVKCAWMGDLATAESGFRSATFIQWGSSANTVKKGSWSSATYTTTTTYGWGNTLSATNAANVECKDDAGLDGDGVDETKLYPSTDTYSIVVVTDSKGKVISTTGTVSGGQLTGVWDAAAKNYWTSNSGNTYTFYSANYLNWYYDSTTVTKRSKISIMQTAATSLLGSVGGINVGLMRYDLNGSGGMVVAPMAPVATSKSTLSTLIKSWAPAGNTPLSETLYEGYLYYSGSAVRFGNSSKSSRCKTWDSQGKCTSYDSFDQKSVAGARSPATDAGTNYNSPGQLFVPEELHRLSDRRSAERGHCRRHPTSRTSVPPGHDHRFGGETVAGALRLSRAT